MRVSVFMGSVVPVPLLRDYSSEVAPPAPPLVPPPAAPAVAAVVVEVATALDR